MTDRELFTKPGICKLCYNLKCKEYRQEFPVSAEYWTEYREKNRAKLTKYNREYMRKRRAKSE